MKLERPCFNFKVCAQVIEVDDRLVWTGGKLPVVPKLNGPFLCPDCRDNPAIFKLARERMEIKFGWRRPPNIFIPKQPKGGQNDTSEVHSQGT